MLDALTEASFAPHTGSEFRIYLDDATAIAAELVEVTARSRPSTQSPWATSSESQRKPFSIILRGPVDIALPQRMYRVEHATIGVIDGLFLVPVGINNDGRFYEAVFS